MTAQEALESIQLWANHQSWGNDRYEALSVLRAVVEDYEKARPLIEGAIVGMNAMELWQLAYIYREGRKP